MNLHGEKVSLGDVVYDVSASRGTGKVTGLDRGVRVVYSSGITLVYDENGVQKGQNRATLFWHNPIMVAPPRDLDGWSFMKSVAQLARREFLSMKQGDKQ